MSPPPPQHLFLSCLRSVWAPISHHWIFMMIYIYSVLVLLHSNSVHKLCKSKGFWRWCVAIRLTAVLNIVHCFGYLLKNSQCFRNWICFHCQVKVGTRAAYSVWSLCPTFIWWWKQIQVPKWHSWTKNRDDGQYPEQQSSLSVRQCLQSGPSWIFLQIWTRLLFKVIFSLSMLKTICSLKQK